VSISSTGAWAYGLDGTLYSDGNSHRAFFGKADASDSSWDQQVWLVKQADGSVLEYTNSSVSKCTYRTSGDTEFDWFSWALGKNIYFAPAGGKDSNGNPADVWTTPNKRGYSDKSLLVSNLDPAVPVLYKYQDGGASVTVEFESYTASPKIDAQKFQPPSDCKKSNVRAAYKPIGKKINKA